MTPKDKAEELVDKFKAYTDAISLTSDLIDDRNHLRNCKQCALIAVDELLKHCYEVMKPFWKEVKQEIQKL